MELLAIRLGAMKHAPSRWLCAPGFPNVGPLATISVAMYNVRPKSDFRNPVHPTLRPYLN
jgi:hypothetical protein